MMQYPRTIRNFNAWVDGQSYAGRAVEGKPPEVKLQTANHRGAGMDGPTPIDQGTEAMQAEVTLMEWAPELIKRFGTKQRLTFRPAARGQNDFSADGWALTIGGLWTVVNFADLKPGTDMPLKLTIEADYFRVIKDGEELLEIDIEAGKRIVGGVDQLDATRAAMGF